MSKYDDFNIDHKAFEKKLETTMKLVNTMTPEQFGRMSETELKDFVVEITTPTEFLHATAKQAKYIGAQIEETKVRSLIARSFDLGEVVCEVRTGFFESVSNNLENDGYLLDDINEWDNGYTGFRVSWI